MANNCNKNNKNDACAEPFDKLRVNGVEAAIRLLTLLIKDAIRMIVSGGRSIVEYRYLKGGGHASE